MRVHPRAVGVEDADDLDRQAALHPVAVEERLGAALALVVARADADRIYVAPVALDLRMDGGIAVHFARRRLQYLGAQTLREPEHVDRAVDAGLHGLHRIALIVDRRRRTGEVVDLVALDVQREGHVVAQHLEAPVVQEVVDVAFVSGVEVVHADHLVPLLQKFFAEPAAEEPAAARYHDAFHYVFPFSDD